MIQKIHQSEDGFSYTYSARQREDVQAIRQKYLPREEDKMAQLRKLDQNVTLYSTIPAVFLRQSSAACTIVLVDRHAPASANYDRSRGSDPPAFCKNFKIIRRCGTAFVCSFVPFAFMDRKLGRSVLRGK